MASPRSEEPDAAAEGDQAEGGAEMEALFETPKAAKSKAVAPAKKKVSLVARTPDGDDASTIIAAWIDWYTASDGVPIPKATISRMSKHVKDLITSGYTSTDIKYGLALWTIARVDNPMLSPSYVDNYTWDWASSTRGNRKQWRAQVVQQVRSMSGNAPSRPRASRQDRHDNNMSAIADWTNRGE